MLVTNNYYFCRTTIHSNLILDNINVTNSSESASPGADEDPQDHSDIETINQQSDSCSESDSEVTNAASKVDFGPRPHVPLIRILTSLGVVILVRW